MGAASFVKSVMREANLTNTVAEGGCILQGADLCRATLRLVRPLRLSLAVRLGR
jgi:uncharacterized protein YjbI with pentapeptide repeats